MGYKFTKFTKSWQQRRKVHLVSYSSLTSLWKPTVSQPVRSYSLDNRSEDWGQNICILLSDMIGCRCIMNNPQRETNLSKLIIWGGVSPLHSTCINGERVSLERHCRARLRLVQRAKRSQIELTMISRVLITALLLSKTTLSKPTTNAHAIKVIKLNLEKSLKAHYQ